MTAQSDWTDEKTGRLISLWDDPANYSSSEIGRRLGVTKSSVTGKAHRLGLAMRPSKANMRIGVISLTRKAVPGKAQRAAARAGSKFDSARLVAVPIQRVREIIAQAPGVRDPHKKCLYTWGQRETGYACCDELVVAGSIWCPDHRSLCSKEGGTL